MIDWSKVTSCVAMEGGAVVNADAVEGGNVGVGQYYQAVQPKPYGGGFRLTPTGPQTWIFKIYRLEQEPPTTSGGLTEVVWHLKLQTQTGPLSMSAAQADQHGSNLATAHCGYIVRWYDPMAGEAAAKSVLSLCFQPFQPSG